MQYQCPACKTPQRLTATPSFSLPPTGGDYEYCQTSTEVDCPGCKAPLSLRVTIWLTDSPTTVDEVRVLPPKPSPWYQAFWMGFFPDGETLAIRSGAGLWLTSREGEGWSPPRLCWEKPPRSSTGSLRASLSVDGLLFSAETGQVFDARGAEVAKLPWESFNIKNLALRPGLEALSLSLSLSYQKHQPSTWLSEVLLCTAQGIKRQTIPAHSGISMSGKSAFSANGDRLLRMHPTFHGSNTWSLELYRIDPKQDAMVQLLATYNRPETISECTQATFEASGDILLSYSLNPYHEKRPHQLVRLDGETLVEKWRGVFPLDLKSSGGHSFTIMPRALLSLDDSQALLLGEKVYRLSLVGEVEVLSCFEAPHQGRALSWDPAHQRLMLSTDYELWEFALESPGSGRQVKLALPE